MHFVSIPMIINMIVAILAVKLNNISGLNDLVELDEPLHALAFVWLFSSGAGWVSIDGLLRQFVDTATSRERSAIHSGARFVQTG